jgi:FAD/FMN-containing dehydrogenase
MPTLQWILDHQDELARKAMAYEPKPEDERDPEPFRLLLAAGAQRARAEAEVAEAVAAARAAGYSWAMIGSAIGTTGQAASQRYGRVAKTHVPRPPAGRES